MSPQQSFASFSTRRFLSACVAPLYIHLHPGGDVTLAVDAHKADEDFKESRCAQTRTTEGVIVMNVSRPRQFGLWGIVLGLLSLGVAAQPAPGDGGDNAPIRITLKNEFINTYRNRATTSDVSFLVDKAHDAPN